MDRTQIEADNGNSALRHPAQPRGRSAAGRLRHAGHERRRDGDAAAQLRPGLPVLFVTGFADLGALSYVGEERIIQEPYRDEELRQKLLAALL